ncbi:hypothetical protein M3M33_17495, partial [Loigolactobacillus coryniformis]|uniref:hypothetical protein n=1 Tax=Loigolactobacillus coryniformis TaxID=1610 RepID=UPI00201AAE8D
PPRCPDVLRCFDPGVVEGERVMGDLVAIRPQTNREQAELVAKFRTPPGFSWHDLANDIEFLLNSKDGERDGVATR